MNLFEFPKHAALLAIGQPWMNDSHMAELLCACALALDLSSDDDPIHHTALTVQNALLDCVADDDMSCQKIRDPDSLRHMIGKLVQWVGAQPNRAVHDSVIKHLKASHESPRTS